MNTVYENATIKSAILKDPDEEKPLTIFKKPQTTAENSPYCQSYNTG